MLYLLSTVPGAFAFTDKDFQKLSKEVTNQGFVQGGYVDKHKDGSFKSSIIISNGLLNGKASVYHKHNIVHKEATFRNGLIEGLYKVYNKDGQLLQSQNLRAGKLNGISQFYKSGHLIEELTYKDDKLHGKYQKFSSTGEKLELGEYADGKQISKQLTPEGIARKKKIIKNTLITIGAITAVVVVAANQKKNKRGYYGGGGASNYQYEGFYCNESLQGCCSYHNGILAVGETSGGNIIPAVYNNRVICNDKEFSPTCYCYPN